MLHYNGGSSKPTEGEVHLACCAGAVCANETNKKETKRNAFFVADRGEGAGEEG